MLDSRILALTSESLGRLKDDAEQITARFAALSGEAAATITVGASGIHDSLREQVISFGSIVGERGGQLVESLSHQTGRMREYIEALDNLVGENGHSVVDRIATHGDELNARIAGHLDAIDVLMQARRNDFDQHFSDHLEQLSAKSAAPAGAVRSCDDRSPQRGRSRPGFAFATRRILDRRRAFAISNPRSTAAAATSSGELASDPRRSRPISPPSSL